ncbi:PREDICTED: uncharacterized protein LOC106808723 [Priapulus caudatus]|uniref:RBR-type E3 ubiquitin transferase n=1 Tax=Priapulus caudatus TaxID=37621 RepID=A0ABM1E4B7_PRICU|nr:PREDICTED: uncharacterized protein LOC106808723 [Priapulus caudatus]
MGSASSKFRKHLQNGDEYAAMQLYNSSPELRKSLDPNMSYGDAYHQNTPLHYVSQHAMKSLLRIFMLELSGNPNKKNIHNQTALHCVCSCPTGKLHGPSRARRADCLTLIIHWRGPQLENGELERVKPDMVDDKCSTAMHYGAKNGLRRCVELLVAAGASVFIENKNKETPCDCAEKAGYSELAVYLESKMVFSNDSSCDVNEADITVIDTQEPYSGLRSQDLQEAKDQLLVETSDMLRVPLFTAEALLRNYEWSRETLLEAWMENPIACCEKCGVQPPGGLVVEAQKRQEQQHGAVAKVTTQDDHEQQMSPIRESSSQSDKPECSWSGMGIVNQDAKIREAEEEEEHPLNTPTRKTAIRHDTVCDICALPFPVFEQPVPVACDHHFCRGCWESYLKIKIQDGNVHSILCPAFQCQKLVPVEVIERLVPRDVALKYLQFDIQAFVESNPTIKWCPHPGCGRAVRLPENDGSGSPATVQPGVKPPPTSHAVDCGVGHFFCWECLGEAHEPCSCQDWVDWFQKISDVKPESLGGTTEETEQAANCLWLVTNSKSCPNCKSPIQKNEGCNHMKCSKCKHDFCWVCLETWKKHSSATGGYFRCNRYEAIKKADEKTDCLKSEVEEQSRRLQELNRFMHYYTRFKNHEQSHQLEEPLLNSAKRKMCILASAIQDEAGSSQVDTKFIEDAIQELLKARRVLRASYVYGYYLEDHGYNKTIFEFMQTELEEVMESLSQMIARPYLRTPRYKIVQTAQLVKRKRHEFVLSVSKGLIPPETPPALRRFRRRHFPNLLDMDLDDKDFRKAITASLKDIDPNDPWVKDSSGRHTNLAALYDWPDYDSDENDVTIAQNASVFGVCARQGCTRPRAQNPRTGAVHDHCSLRCSRTDKLGKPDEETASPPAFVTDYHMELMLALEMSRLQLMQDMGSSTQLHVSGGPSHSNLQAEGTPLNNAPSQQQQTTVKANSVGTSSDMLSSSPLDPRSLREVLNVSRLVPPENADDDPNLRIAIELSLQDSNSPIHLSSLPAATTAAASANTDAADQNEEPSLPPEGAQNNDAAAAPDTLPTLAFSDTDGRACDTWVEGAAGGGDGDELPDTLVLPQVKLESLFLKDLEDKQLDYSNNLRTKSPKEDLKTAKQLFKFDSSLDETSESILRNINRKIITDVSKVAEVDAEVEAEERNMAANFDIAKFPRTQTAPCSLERSAEGDAVAAGNAATVIAAATRRSGYAATKGIAISHNNLSEDGEESLVGAVGGCERRTVSEGMEETAAHGRYVPRRQTSYDSPLSCSPELAGFNATTPHNIVHGLTGFDARPLGSGAAWAESGDKARAAAFVRGGPSSSASMGCVHHVGSPLGFRPLVATSSSSGNLAGVPAAGDVAFPDEIPVTEKFRAIQAMPKIEKKSRAESPLGAMFRRSSSRRRGKNPDAFLSGKSQSPVPADFNNRTSSSSAGGAGGSGSGNTTPADCKHPVIWMKRENKERERSQIDKRQLERSHSEEGTASCRITSPPSSGKGYLLRTYSQRSKKDRKFGRVSRDQDKKSDKEDKRKKKLKKLALAS